MFKESEYSVKKILRQCQHNVEVIAKTRKGPLKYDFGVYLNTELTAVFRPLGFKTGYHLLDRAYNVIRGRRLDEPPKTLPRTYYAKNKTEFLRVFTLAYRAGAVPTVEEIATAEQERIKEAAIRQAGEAEWQRKQLIQDAAEDLLTSCAQAVATLQAIAQKTRQEDIAQSALSQAKNLQDVIGKTKSVTHEIADIPLAV